MKSPRCSGGGPGGRGQPLRLVSLVLAVSLIAASCALISAETVAENSGRMAKVGPELIALYDEYSSYVASQRPGAFRPGNPLVRVIDGRVVIDAVASGEARELQSDLVALGMRGAVAFGRVVSGELPISAVPSMAALPSLKFARAAAASVRGERAPRPPAPPDP